MLTAWGHAFVNAGEKGMRTPHDPALMRSFQFASQISDVIASHRHHNDDITTDDIRDQYLSYRFDPQMQATDAILCTFPAGACESYERLNRTLLFLPVHRFSLGRCNVPSYRRLVSRIQAWAASGEHIIAAASVYDVEYMEYFTGVRPILLNATALWYTAHHVRLGPPNNMAPEILLGPLGKTQLPFRREFNAAMSRLQASLVDPPFTFAFASELYGHYKFADIVQHRAIVVFPRATVSYGSLEAYALGIPMFVPSIAFAVRLGLVDDRFFTGTGYCNNFNRSDLTVYFPRHPFNPEDPSMSSSMYWLRFAEEYQWPHVQIFSSWEDLVRKLHSVDLEAIHSAMVATNQARMLELHSVWEGKVFTRIRNRNSLSAG
jgi:hypothetical protein